MKNEKTPNTQVVKLDPNGAYLRTYRVMWCVLMMIGIAAGVNFGISLAGLGLNFYVSLFGVLATVVLALTLYSAGDPANITPKSKHPKN